MHKLAPREVPSKAQVYLFHAIKDAFPKHEVRLEAKVQIDIIGKKDLFADVLFPKQKLIVEYNGDYWHCNPAIGKYLPDFFHPKKNATAQEIWAEDARRINILNANGYDVYVVWESEFKKSVSDVIAKIARKLDEKHG